MAQLRDVGMHLLTIPKLHNPRGYRRRHGLPSRRDPCRHRRPTFPEAIPPFPRRICPILLYRRPSRDRWLLHQLCHRDSPEYRFVTRCKVPRRCTGRLCPRSFLRYCVDEVHPTSLGLHVLPGHVHRFHRAQHHPARQHGHVNAVRHALFRVHLLPHHRRARHARAG